MCQCGCERTGTSNGTGEVSGRGSHLLRLSRSATYDVYLAKGYPIGSGVVEGACKHLVKDRMECTGMRWSKEGAQATLDLRAVSINGDWTAFWRLHAAAQRGRLYRGAAAAGSNEGVAAA